MVNHDGTADDRSGSRWRRDCAKNEHLFRRVLLVALQRFTEDADILANLVHRQEQRARLGTRLSAARGVGNAVCR